METPPYNSLSGDRSRLLRRLRHHPLHPFPEINSHSRIQPFLSSLRKRGAAIIDDVVPQSLTLQWKSEIRTASWQILKQKRPRKKALLPLSCIGLLDRLKLVHIRMH